MTSNLVTRIQRLFGQSHDILEGEDTGNLSRDELTDGVRALHGQEQSDREWTDLLAWDSLAAPDDDAEWVTKIARAKAGAEAAESEQAEWRLLIERAKAGRSSAPPARSDLAKAMAWMRAGAKAGAVG